MLYFFLLKIIQNINSKIYQKNIANFFQSICYTKLANQKVRKMNLQFTFHALYKGSNVNHVIRICSLRYLSYIIYIYKGSNVNCIIL